ncbi:MAG: RsbRD N-terminal domain-containing protein [Thermodesulfobacteriota bacterium]|nr:RsbRD N-terminal domain-containing protein [Thermodesulfobacteriota bacterium]
MKIEDLLAKKKSTILKRWFALLAETYPPDTSKFLKKQKDKFANPVGEAVIYGLEGVYDELRGGMDAERLAHFLDRIIRVRALQKFTPSQGLNFIFQLKGLIREVLNKDIQKEGLFEEMTVMDVRIDKLALLAFDVYAACLEKLYEIRVNDEKRKLHMLLRKANLLIEVEEAEVELPDLRND